jgi:hypothetical protein
MSRAGPLPATSLPSSRRPSALRSRRALRRPPAFGSMRSPSEKRAATCESALRGPSLLRRSRRGPWRPGMRVHATVEKDATARVTAGIPRTSAGMPRMPVGWGGTVRMRIQNR